MRGSGSWLNPKPGSFGAHHSDSDLVLGGSCPPSGDPSPRPAIPRRVAPQQSLLPFRRTALNIGIPPRSVKHDREPLMPRGPSSLLHEWSTAVRPVVWRRWRRRARLGRWCDLVRWARRWASVSRKGPRPVPIPVLDVSEHVYPMCPVCTGRYYVGRGGLRPGGSPFRPSAGSGRHEPVECRGGLRPRPLALWRSGTLLLVRAAAFPCSLGRPGRRRSLRPAFCEGLFTARQQLVRLASGKAAFAFANGCGSARA